MMGTVDAFPPTCPTCGAAVHPLDPIGGVDGPAVVECEAGHQTDPGAGLREMLARVGEMLGPPMEPDEAVRVIGRDYVIASKAENFFIGPGPYPSLTVGSGLTPGMLAKIGGFDKPGSIQVPADWWRGGETLTSDDA